MFQDSLQFTSGFHQSPMDCFKRKIKHLFLLFYRMLLSDFWMILHWFLRHLSIISDYNSQGWGWNGAPNWNVNMAAGWGVNLGEGSKVIHLKFLFFNNEYSGTQFSVIQYL